jgi:signal transduction histidine kinase
MISPAGDIQAELAASDVMRAIAHELRQPLSTIGSIAYYLSLILPRDDGKVHEQLGRLQQLVEQSSWILTNGQHLTEAPHGAPEPIDIEGVILHSISARSGAGDIPVQLELAGNLPQVQIDPGLAGALIENLLTLFRLVSGDLHPTTLRTLKTAAAVSLEIVTRATGFRSEAALGPGSSLGLECARRIVERHHGTMELSVDPSQGIRMIVTLPTEVLP